MNDTLSFDSLTPVRFLDRAVSAHGDRVAVIDGDDRFSYREFGERCHRLARAILADGQGGPVAVLAPNTHVMLEAHFGVPLSGRPLVTVNTRLASAEIAYILDHSEAGILIAHLDYADLVTEVLRRCGRKPRVIFTGDEYEALLAGAGTEPVAVAVDERSLLSINYTSGTTGRPKGVMYHHRGAYLQALAMVGHNQLTAASAYLWTLPMFHCNGWTFPWAVTAVGATHVCLRRVEPDLVWRCLDEHGVTHLSGAPAVLSMIAYARDAETRAQARAGMPPIRVTTGGAPPSPAILARMSSLNFEVTHLYGLTETYGPAMICDWRPEWDDLDADRRSRLKARQGVANLIGCRARVIADGREVPRDGTTIGEICFRGNNVMLGYLKDPRATAEAAPDGWFRSGDLGVVHPDGYVELRDRRKDVIISGGENISSVEVEQVLAAHPAVREVAVIAIPDERWGEVPAAYIDLHDDASVTDGELAAHVRRHLAGFKVPKRIVFQKLPHTSTGKIQKFVLRKEAWSGTSTRIT
jgi:fatty-acyl-CoA synthase